MTMPVVRAATLEDAAAIVRIDNHHDGSATP
jgi:hypothetical protein